MFGGRRQCGASDCRRHEPVTGRSPEAQRLHAEVDGLRGGSSQTHAVDRPVRANRLIRILLVGDLDGPERRRRPDTMSASCSCAPSSRVDLFVYGLSLKEIACLRDVEGILRGDDIIELRQFHKGFVETQAARLALECGRNQLDRADSGTSNRRELEHLY